MKKRICVCIDKEVWIKAKELKLNISKVCEDALREKRAQVASNAK